MFFNIFTPLYSWYSPKNVGALGQLPPMPLCLPTYNYATAMTAGIRSANELLTALLVLMYVLYTQKIYRILIIILRDK